jgi:hypothetical protein
MEEVIIHKIGWCFTCDTHDCQHIQNANQSLINSLQHKEDEDDGNIS